MDAATCCCSELDDLAVVGMGDTEGLDERLFDTLDSVKDHGGGQWWLHASICRICGQNWMIAQDERIHDNFCLKRIDPGTKRLIRSGENTLNPYDRHAIEAAVQLKESGVEAEITVVTVAPATATRTVDKALAQGGDRSVHLADDALAGSDIAGTAYALATLLQRDAYDLVLFGQQASDAECYVLAAAVAEHLRRPCVTQVAALALDGSTAKVKRQVETGYDTLEVPLPAVLSVSDAINEPRYPSLKGIMGAKKKPQDTLSVGDLGLDASAVGAAGSGTEVVSLSPPPARGDTKVIEDDGSAAEQVVAFLAERKLI